MGRDRWAKDVRRAREIGGDSDPFERIVKTWKELQLRRGESRGLRAIQSQKRCSRKMKTRDGCFSLDTRIREDRSLKESCCDSEGRRNCTQSVKCIEHNGCINRDSRKKDN